MSKFHTNQLAGFPEKSGRWQMQVHKGLRGVAPFRPFRLSR